MWQKIKDSPYPVVLYGTGNAADRIIDQLEQRGIPIAGIFASDGFVRDRTFHGIPVISYDEAKARFAKMTVVLCFGSHLPQVIDRFAAIDREQELYAPDLPVTGEGLFTEAYAQSCRAKMEKVRSLLADEKSRQVWDDIMEYRLTGRLAPLLRCATPDEENWKLVCIGPDETYLDLGAYTGDTVQLFCSFTDSWQQIVAVEPESRNFRKLCRSAETLSDCTCLQLAVSDGPGRLPLSKGLGRGGAGGKGKITLVEADSIDNIVKNDCRKPPTLIKFDLEGEEGRVLRGGAQVLRQYRPKLILAAYHRIDDLWELPLQVLAINPSYRVYLRRSPCVPCWESNFYMV